MEKRIVVPLWKELTEKELQERGKDLSDAVIAHADLSFKKRESQAAFRKQLDEMDGIIARISGEIRAKGYEGPTQCIVRFHLPRIAFKQVVRVDTGELVREEQMTAAECQANLFEAKEMDALNRIYEQPDERQEPPTDQ